MRYQPGHRLWPVALVFALWALLAWALPVSAEGDVIEGKLRNGTAGAAPPAGLAVTLEQVASGGGPATALETKTDEGGSFRFAPVDAAAGQTYIVSAKYRDVTYRSAPLATESGGATKPIELTVFETTDSDAAVNVDVAHAVLQPDQEGQGLWVIEVLVLNNTGDRAYVGDPKLSLDGKQPTLRFSLPPGVHSPQPMQGFDPNGILEIVNGFAVTEPLPPGQRNIAYSYFLPPEGNDFIYSRAVDYPTKRFAVLTAETGGRIEADRLAQGETADLGGQRYQTFFAEDLPAGDSVMLRVSGSAAATSSATDLSKIVGGVAVMAILVGAGSYLRRRRPRPAGPTRANGAAREQLIAEIADLDDAFEAGDIAEEEYRAQRAAHKKKLAKLVAVQVEG